MTTEITPKDAAPQKPPQKKAPPKKPTAQRSSRPVMNLEITFSSAPANKTYAKHFPYVSAALYHLCVMVPILSSPSISVAIEDLLNTWLNETSDSLKKEVARLQNILETGDATDQQNYSAKTKVVAEITTPQATRFVRCLEQFDRCNVLVDACWLSGLFSNNQHNQVMYHAGNRVARLAGRIRNLKNHLTDMTDLGKDAKVSDLGEEFIRNFLAMPTEDALAPAAQAPKKA